MPPSNENSMFLPECAKYEVGEIISQLQNNKSSDFPLGCALFYKPIWQLTVNERGHYADSEDTFLFKIEDSPDTRLGA